MTLDPLTETNHFLFNVDQAQSFQLMKKEIAENTLIAIDSSLSQKIEIDAGDHIIKNSLTLK